MVRFLLLSGLEHRRVQFLKDAEAAVRSGENDCLLAESGEVAKYREDKRLHSVFLTQDGNVSLPWHAEMSP